MSHQGQVLMGTGFDLRAQGAGWALSRALSEQTGVAPRSSASCPSADGWTVLPLDPDTIFQSLICPGSGVLLGTPQSTASAISWPGTLPSVNQLTLPTAHSQRRTLRLREAKQLAQGHTVRGAWTRT